MAPDDDPTLPDLHARLALGLLLTALGGMLDAIGYVRMDHLFLSFMSGNSVHLGISLAGLDMSAVGLALAVIGCFVAGTFVGDLLGTAVRPQARLAALLGLQAGVMLAAAGAVQAGWNKTGLALVALGLGIQNIVTLEYRGVALGRTYLSGSLVQFGQALAALARGASSRVSAFVLLATWTSFVLGGVSGALLTPINLPGILLGIGIELGALALWTHRLSPGLRALLHPSPKTRDRTS